MVYFAALLLGRLETCASCRNLGPSAARPAGGRAGTRWSVRCAVPSSSRVTPSCSPTSAACTRKGCGRRRSPGSCRSRAGGRHTARALPRAVSGRCWRAWACVDQPQRPSAVVARRTDEFTVTEVAARLNLPEGTVYNWLYKGQLPARRVVAACSTLWLVRDLDRSAAGGDALVDQAFQRGGRMRSSRLSGCRSLRRGALALDGPARRRQTSVRLARRAPSAAGRQTTADRPARELEQ